MKWKYDPLLCSYECETKFGKYFAVRTAFDISKLYFNGECLFISSVGSHNLSIEFAENHYKELLKNEQNNKN